MADSGAIVLVENEGNARLSTSAPKIHIAVAGIEKIIPRAQDLAVFLNLLGRSATGQPLTVYTSFLAGPRRAGEIDGPDEFYLVLLDNGRTKLLADPEKRQSLYCIRCGACLSHCPVYQKIGGHSYPWVYSGPIGAIITPQFHGVMSDPWLPFASSLCGRCAEVCPVKIDIPKLLLKLRAEVTQPSEREGSNRRERLAFRVWAWVMTPSQDLFVACGDRRETVSAASSDRSVAEMGQSARLAKTRPQSFHQWWATPKRIAMTREGLSARERLFANVRTALRRAASQPLDQVAHLLRPSP